MDAGTHARNAAKLITGLVTAPGRTLSTLAENPRGYWDYALVVFSISILSSSFASAWFPTGLDDLVGLDTTLDFPVYMAAVFNSAIATLIAYAVIMWAGNRGAERRANFRTVFVVLACAAIPALLVGVPMAVLAYLVPGLEILAPVSIGVFVWQIILEVKGVKTIYGYGTAKSFGIWLLGGLAGVAALLPSYLVLGF